MSIRSRLEANPLVQDTDKELERLEEERKTNEINLGGGLGFEE
jgi:diaminopimelate decarboxylase